MDHPYLARLWQLAATASRAKGSSPNGAFESIGLILQRPPKLATYAQTPPNTLAFAWTGGDGVHFNFVLGSDLAVEDNPILMVVPMSFKRPRAVVGRSLRRTTFGVEPWTDARAHLDELKELERLVSSETKTPGRAS
jgi:hypothetical protein